MMKTKWMHRCGVALALWFGVAGGWAAETTGATRIALFGDDITQGGWQTEWLQYFLATRYPYHPVYVANCGVDCDTVAGALKRVDWDLLAQRPDLIYIMFGMNDIDRALYREEPPSPDNAARRRTALDAYGRALETLLKRLDREKAAVFVLTPSPYDQYSPGDPPPLAHANDALGQCAAIVRRSVRDHRAGAIELNRVMTQWLQEHPERRLAGDDRIHPDPVDEWFIASQLMENYAGPVASLEVSAVGAVLSQEYCRIAESDFADGHIRFLYLPKALPLAPTPELAEFVKLVPDFAARFNSERLSVSLLPAGDYELAGDGNVFGTFSAAQLAQGINLAELNTPSVRQSFEVDALVRELHALHARLRAVAYARRIMADNGVADPVAPDAGEKFFPQFIELHTGEERAQLEAVYAAFREDEPHLAELEARREALWESIFVAAKPRGWFLELRRVEKTEPAPESSPNPEPASSLTPSPISAPPSLSPQP